MQDDQTRVATGIILPDGYMTVAIDSARRAARLAIVDEHVRAEETHELDGVNRGATVLTR